MKNKYITIAVSSLLLFLSPTVNTIADENSIPITAEQAFDAVTKQVDPLTGEETRIALVDIRTTAEFYWVGGCGKVESIETQREVYYPKNGKVKIRWGSYLVFRNETARRNRVVYLPLRRVTKIHTDDISIHIPKYIWDEGGATKSLSPYFTAQVASLGPHYDAIILMGRSGEGSTVHDFGADLFGAVYEIDQPDGSDGYGGFQGNAYGNAYNGFRGFPGRKTWRNKTRSVSWADAGLPIHIGSQPDVLDVPETPTDQESESDNSQTGDSQNTNQEYQEYNENEDGANSESNNDYFVSDTPR